MSDSTNDAVSPWETCVGISFLLLIGAMVAAICYGMLWLAFVLAAPLFAKVAIETPEGRSAFWLASAVCPVLGLLGWLYVSYAAQPTASHWYWGQLRDVCLEAEAAAQDFEANSPQTTPKQLSSMAREISQEFRKASDAIKHFPVTGVDENVVEHAADLCRLFDSTAASIASISSVVEESNVATSQQQPRWNKWLAGVEVLLQREHELNVREMHLRAALTERLGGDFPPLTIGSAAIASSEAAHDGKAQEAGKESDGSAEQWSPAMDVGRAVVGFVYDRFGLPGVVLCAIPLLQLGVRLLFVMSNRGETKENETQPSASQEENPDSGLSPYDIFLFRVLGHIAKSDGAVTKAEVRVAEEWIAFLNLGTTQRDQAIRCFTEGKSVTESSRLLAGLAEAAAGSAGLPEVAIHAAISMAAADGFISEPEEAIIRALHSAMMPLDFAIEDALRAANENCPYRILGITPPADIAAVKKAYRAKCREFHPDHLGSKNLPPEMEAFAAERMRKIQDAYDFLVAAL